MGGHAPNLKEPTVGRPPAKKPTPAAPPEDPLADLRQDDDGPGLILPGGGQVGGDGILPLEEPEEPEAGEVRPMVSQEVLDEMVTEAVVAFHRDPTSQGFLHGGGQCGCRYLARVALSAAVPVVTEADVAEQELEPADPEGSSDG